MRSPRIILVLGAMLTFFWLITVINAQTIPKSLQESGPEAAIKDRKNAWVLGLAGGLLEGTRLRFVDELARLVNDGDNFRVLPFISDGAASNLEDLVYLHGVDLAITQSDIFGYFRNVREIPNLEKRYTIFRFPISEVHIIARDNIHSIDDLRGRKVRFGSEGAAGSLTGPIVFQRFGIDVQQVGDTDNPTALYKLLTGEIDAVLRVSGKPVDYVSKIPPNSGVHLLPIPYTRKLTDYYSLGEFTNLDYPNLIRQDERVDTIGVPGVLAVYNWPKNTDRYRRIERFVGRLFDNWERLQKPPFHPKWKDINLAATVPGWTRFVVAEQGLRRVFTNAKTDDSSPVHSSEFQNSARNASGPGTLPNETQGEALFREFLRWRQSIGSH